jgi:hypothetical protein
VRGDRATGSRNPIVVSQIPKTTSVTGPLFEIPYPINVALRFYSIGATAQMTTSVLIYDAPGAARFIGKSEAWARYSFQSGVIPTELLINGRKPAVTAPTLKRLAPQLRKQGSGRKLH